MFNLQEPGKVKAASRTCFGLAEKDRYCAPTQKGAADKDLRLVREGGALLHSLFPHPKAKRHLC